MRTLTAYEANNMLVLQVRISCSLLSFTTPVSLLANEFDARSVMHGQVSLAAVNHIYVIHGVTNGCKNLKESLNSCFETINTDTYTIFHAFHAFHAFVHSVKSLMPYPPLLKSYKSLLSR